MNGHQKQKEKKSKEARSRAEEGNTRKTIKILYSSNISTNFFSDKMC